MKKRKIQEKDRIPELVGNPVAIKKIHGVANVQIRAKNQAKAKIMTRKRKRRNGVVAANDPVPNPPHPDQVQAVPDQNPDPILSLILSPDLNPIPRIAKGSPNGIAKVVKVKIENLQEKNPNLNIERNPDVIGMIQALKRNIDPNPRNLQISPINVTAIAIVIANLVANATKRLSLQLWRQVLHQRGKVTLYFHGNFSVIIFLIFQ